MDTDRYIFYPLHWIQDPAIYWVGISYLMNCFFTGLQCQYPSTSLLEPLVLISLFTAFSRGAILNFLLTAKCTFTPLEGFAVK